MVGLTTETGNVQNCIQGGPWGRGQLCNIKQITFPHNVEIAKAPRCLMPPPPTLLRGVVSSSDHARGARGLEPLCELLERPPLGCKGRSYRSWQIVNIFQLCFDIYIYFDAKCHVLVVVACGSKSCGVDGEPDALPREQFTIS